jgi:hypothetical protein
MKITDHDTHHYGKSAEFRFWVQFQSMTGEEETYTNFADFASYLVASGEFDGYDDSTEEGEVWRYLDGEEGRCESYTFGEVISEFMLTGDFDRYLSDYLRVKISIEQLAA